MVGVNAQTCGTADGVFGSNCKAAVQQYQKAAGLAAALYAEKRLSMPILQESLRKNGVVLHENELKERVSSHDEC